MCSKSTGFTRHGTVRVKTLLNNVVGFLHLKQHQKRKCNHDNDFA